jgi:hypothetical protein
MLLNLPAAACGLSMMMFPVKTKWAIEKTKVQVDLLTYEYKIQFSQRNSDKKFHQQLRGSNKIV